MAKSPKTTTAKPKDGDMKIIKSILKEPKPKKEPVQKASSKKAESPPQLIPIPKTTKKDSKVSSISTDKSPTGEEDDEYYHDIFFDIVSKELPLVKTAGGTDAYPYEHLQDDIVCIIDEIYEKSGYLVVPDTDMIQKIAQLKIPNDKKLQNDFIFGTDKNMDGGIYSTIKKYTDPIRKNQWAEIEHKYGKKVV